MASAWLKKNEDWLGRPKKPVQKKKEKPKDDNISGIIYVPIRCPFCQSKNNKCYTSRPPIRYHICKDCGMRFKSIEQDSAT